MPPGGSRQKIDPTPRGRLIAAATNLFCQRGINAVGVDAIVEEAGTAKTTLYKLFGSKEHLVEAVLGRRGRGLARLVHHLDDAGRRGRAHAPAVGLPRPRTVVPAKAVLWLPVHQRRRRAR